MDWLKIDDWWEMAIFGLVILAALGMILSAVRGGLKLRVGKAEVGEAAASPPPVQEEHEAHFARLDEALERLADIEAQNSAMLRGIDGMQRAQNRLLGLMARKMQGESINGEMTDALREIAKWEGYKEAAVAAEGVAV